MIVRFHDDPAAFERIAFPHLLRAEAENMLILGVAGQIIAGGFDDFWLATLETDEGVVGCALQTPPHWVVLTQAPAAEVAALASELVGRVGLVTDVPGVIGAVSACDVFAEAWCRETGAASTQLMSQGVFQLDQVIPPARPASGHLRVMAPGDEDQVAEWHSAFQDDTGIVDTRDGQDVAREHLQAGSLFVWEDGGRPVSMASVAGPTPHGIRVNFVYTPPECRGHGYASTCVAEVSQRLLDGGRDYCFLFTDLENPTTNAIYRAIGYRKVTECVLLGFNYSKRMDSIGFTDEARRAGT